MGWSSFWRLYRQLGLRMLGVVALLMLCRLLFLATHGEYFPNISNHELVGIWLSGLAFDIAATCYTNFVYLHLYFLPLKLRHHPVFRDVLDSIFVLTNGVVLMASTIDIARFPHTFDRLTSSFFFEVWQAPNTAMLIASSAVEHWEVSLIFLGLLLTLGFLTLVVPVGDDYAGLDARAYVIAALGVLPVFSITVIVGSWGGWTGYKNPLGPSRAHEFVSNPHYAMLVSNTPLSILRAPKPQAVDVDTRPTHEYFPVHRPIEDPPKEPRPNVLILAVEGLGANFVRSYSPWLGDGATGYTQYISELSRSCRSYRYAYSSGFSLRHTMPSLLLALPALEPRLLDSLYRKNKVRGLAHYLSTMGYETHFFHGVQRDPLGVIATAETAGFSKIHTMASVPNADSMHDGIWGIWDMEFLQYMAEALNQQKEPFAAMFLSLTTRRPYAIPQQYASILPNAPTPAQQALAYTDLALRRFMESIASAPWKKNTLVILTGATPGPQHSPAYAHSAGRLRVPLILCHESSLRGWNNNPAQHSDVLPTVLRYVGYPRPFVAFGKDLLATAEDMNAAIASHPTGVVQVAEPGFVGEFFEDKIQGLYRTANQPPVYTDVQQEQPKVARDLLSHLDKVRQQYYLRLKRNKLTVNPR